MGELSRVAVCYIFIITICWVVVFYLWLRQREMMRKNKHKYDLRNINFEIETKGLDSWVLNFYYFGNLLHSEVVSEADLMNDKAYNFKAFVRWCESDEKQG